MRHALLAGISSCVVFSSCDLLNTFALDTILHGTLNKKSMQAVELPATGQLYGTQHGLS